MIGDSRDSAGSGMAGTVSLVLGGPAKGEHTMDEAACIVMGSSMSESVGTSQDVADVTGDGVSDVLVLSTQAFERFGAVFVLELPCTGTTYVTEHLALTGAKENELTSATIGSAGDVDNDGSDDLLLGFPTWSDDKAKKGDRLGAAILVPGSSF